MGSLGGKMREARQAAGFSLATMAAKTHFTKGHLSNVERGCRPATPELVAAYELVLGEDMRRRQVLTGAVATSIAPTAVGELLRAGFAARLDGAGRTVDEWLDVVQRYGVDYMSTHVGEMQSRIAGDLVILQQQLDHPQLWATAAWLMALYGKVSPDNHGPDGAITWYRLAAKFADRSGDEVARVWVRGRAALALAYEGASLAVADQLARQALAISDAPSIGRLNAATAHAHVVAMRQGGAAAVGALEHARRLFDVAGSDEQISDFAIPEWRWHIHESMLLSRMGHPRAVDEQDWTDRTRPPSLPRFATHVELHRALMLVHSGDRTGGVEYGQAALDRLPVERRSLSLQLMYAEIEQAVAR